MIGRAYAATAPGAEAVPFWQAPETWLLVAFAVFVGILAKPLYRRITGALDDRAAQIRGELEEAQRLREEAQATLANYQRKQRGAAKEAEEILRHAEDEAKRLTARAEAALERTLERREALAKEKIAQSQARAVDQVRDEAVEVALAATRALIAERIDAARGETLIDEAVKDLPARLK